MTPNKLASKNAYTPRSIRAFGNKHGRYQPLYTVVRHSWPHQPSSTFIAWWGCCCCCCCNQGTSLFIWHAAVVLTWARLAPKALKQFHADTQERETTRKLINKNNLTLPDAPNSANGGRNWTCRASSAPRPDQGGTIEAGSAAPKRRLQWETAATVAAIKLGYAGWTSALSSLVLEPGQGSNAGKTRWWASKARGELNKTTGVDQNMSENFWKCTKYSPGNNYPAAIRGGGILRPRWRILSIRILSIRIYSSRFEPIQTQGPMQRHQRILLLHVGTLPL